LFRRNEKIDDAKLILNTQLLFLPLAFAAHNRAIFALYSNIQGYTIFRSVLVFSGLA